MGSVISRRERTRRRDLAARNFRHGGKGTPEYNAWAAMRSRCLQPRHPAYQRYGGRGIRIVARWSKFVAFLQDMGPRPSPGHSLDRIDNDGPYSPRNCRWTTRKIQARNTRACRIVEYMGERMPLVAAAELAGAPYGRVKCRLYSGWTVAEALDPQKRR